MIPHGYQYVRTYIGLPIDASTFVKFPESVSWSDNTLLKKDNFHVTLCKGEDIWQMAGLETHTGEKKLLDLFESFVKESPIVLDKFVKDFRFMEKEEKKSIVIRCVLKNLDRFFAALNEEFEIDMPLQPAHATLYTLQKNIGIHIPTESDMLSLEKVSLPELDEAYESLNASA